MSGFRNMKSAVCTRHTALLLCLAAPSLLLLGVSAQTPRKPANSSQVNSSSAIPVPNQEFSKTVTPFMRDYCVKCHGPEKQQAKLRLDTLPDNFDDPATKSKWAAVVNVLNSHQMPPPNEKQPLTENAGKLTDWITHELGRAEVAKRSTHVVLRRLNRAEYNNTIRDLVGVDFQPADQFPEDPPAGGFDNIGKALTVSPLHMEMYYAAARQIMDRALVEGAQPPLLKWHFEPEENRLGMDQFRVKRDGQSILLNSGANPVERLGGSDFTVIHHESWDKGIDFRGFALPYDGEYILRFRAAGRVPDRAQVVASAKRILQKRYDESMASNPLPKANYQQQMEEDLKHFRTHRAYDYGPPRIKITQHLGSAPHVIVEMDIDAPETAPKVYEVHAHFTKQDAGIDLHYAYSLPHYLENFWMQGKDEFARPVLLVDWVELEGPIYPVWPPQSQRNLLPELAVKGQSETELARAVLKRFMPRAYRRPVTPQEIEAKVALFQKYRADKPTFLEAMKLPLAAVLASPNFLYLVEPERSAGGSQRLTGYELASRLSYFLWSSMPDDTLLQLAATNALCKPDVLSAQVNRMLANPKSEAFVKNFTGQWLGLRKVGANPPSENLYPDYDRHLETSMVRETEGFFSELLHNNEDARNLIKSDFVTINERLARFYGIPGVRGDAIRKVSAPTDSHRGGLITQASIQTITSNGTRTSPVTRGVWVLRTLLGTDPGLPIANVGEIATKVPGIDRATVRQRLQIHRQNPACARCHDKIDPLGFAMENYNACGEWRDREGHGYAGRIQTDDPLIDTSSTMPDGTPIKGVDGLQSQLLKREDLFLNTLASQMTTYALGRELGFSDQPAIRASVSAMKRHGYSVRSLITTIVNSDQFTSR